MKERRKRITRQCRLQFMVTDKEKERFEDLAYGLGLTVSDLIRRLLSQAADKEVYCNDKAD